MLTYATKKLLTGTNGLQKEFAQLYLLSAQQTQEGCRLHAASPFVSTVMIDLSLWPSEMIYISRQKKPGLETCFGQAMSM